MALFSLTAQACQKHSGQHASITSLTSDSFVCACVPCVGERVWSSGTCVYLRLCPGSDSQLVINLSAGLRDMTVPPRQPFSGGLRASDCIKCSEIRSWGKRTGHKRRCGLQTTPNLHLKALLENRPLRWMHYAVDASSDVSVLLTATDRYCHLTTKKMNKQWVELRARCERGFLG